MKIALNLFIILIVLNTSLFSQEISQMNVIGSGSFLKSELIDRNITDANGEVCAGLMIQTDLSGLSYDSNNGIVKVNHSPGKDILFLSPNERVVEVFKSDYKPLKIILSEFNVDLKSGQMWKLDITGDKIGDLIPITLISKPSGANVFIDGVDKGIGTTFQVSEGEHTVKFEKKGTNTLTDVINVSHDNILFSYQLDISQLQVVTISSVPTGVSVSIDGEIIGTTDMQKFLAPGSYSLSFQKEGFTPKDLEINVQANKSNVFEIKLKELPKVVGDLQFSIKPFKANVILYRDNRIFESWNGLKILNNLLVGEYKIIASLMAYKSITKDIVIKKGEITIVDLVLEGGFSKGGEMILVEGGTFQMGSNYSESDESPEHSVTLSSFLIGKYEVTIGEYNLFCSSTGRKELQVEESEMFYPISGVNWYTANEYCKWAGGRLPTEAEWEYAAKGGTKSEAFKYSGSNNLVDVGWFKSTSSQSHEVGTKAPNELGIYDMSGNVWEWCSDWYYSEYYRISPTKNPKGASPLEAKVQRGGSWFYNSSYCLVNTRKYSSPKKSYTNGGFRLVKDIKNEDTK